MTRRNRKNIDGELFVVRSFDGKDIALGLSVRGGNKTIRLGYFFRLTGLEYYKDVDRIRLSPRSAIYITRFGGLKLRNGNWPVIGRLKGFSHEDWPIPIFVHENSINKEKEYFLYDDANNIVGHYTAATLPDEMKDIAQGEDGLAGPVYVENRIMIILNSINN